MAPVGEERRAALARYQEVTQEIDEGAAARALDRHGWNVQVS